MAGLKTVAALGVLLFSTMGPLGCTPAAAALQRSLNLPLYDSTPVEEGKGEHLCPHAQALIQQFEAEQHQAAAHREQDTDTDVTHYLLELEILPQYSGPDVTAVLVAGTCTIDAQATGDGLTLFTVDLHSNLTVNSVTGNVASWTRITNAIEIALDSTYQTGEAFQVVIDYGGDPQSAGFGAFKWWVREGNLVVATLSQPYYARNWWPCKDALEDKSTMQMQVVVPDPMVVVSNGQQMGTETLTGGRTKYLWEETYPMIPYLASLAITNYECYDLQYDYEEGGPQSMPVLCYVYPDHWDYGADEPLASYKTGCDELTNMLGTFGSVYGLYPFRAEKYGVVETGGTGGLSASMEHQTVSSMSRINNYSDIMAHELSHQWWGDNVTCATWYDIWLNEGFASYSESLYREFKPAGGASSYWARVNERRPNDPDRQVYRTSISSTGAIFSSNDVYNKGSWVLHMLRHVMGTEAFFQAVANYRAAYQGSSATTADFTASFSASFGADLTFFTDEWVMNPGSPDYQWYYEHSTIAGQHYLKLAIRQEQDGDGYGLITMPIDLRVTTTGGIAQRTVFNDGWTEYYVLPVSGTVTDVEFDEDGGVDNRNWILCDSVVQLSTPVEGPPVVLQADIEVFTSTPGQTTVELVFSEDITSFEAGDVSLTGDAGGAQTPLQVSYSPAAQTATVSYAGLPDDAYTFSVLDDAVVANGKALDGEISDTDWWDNALLPSGDGQPGGDAVFTFTKLTGDADGDGDLDLADFVSFSICLTGPEAGPYAAGCGVFDFDTDGDVDLADLAAFQAEYGGS